MLIIRHCISPTTVDNIVTWDYRVLMEAMIVGFKVDFAWILQEVMHKRDFKVTTSYLFPCLVFALCRSVGVPIRPIDQI